MKLTLTTDDIEKACQEYFRLEANPGLYSVTDRGQHCPLANALRRVGKLGVYVSYEDATWYEMVYPNDRHKVDLSQQARKFTEEFDQWFDRNYVQGSLGNFAGRTIKLWED